MRPALQSFRSWVPQQLLAGARVAQPTELKRSRANGVYSGHKMAPTSNVGTKLWKKKQKKILKLGLLHCTQTFQTLPSRKDYAAWHSDPFTVCPVLLATIKQWPDSCFLVVKNCIKFQLTKPQIFVFPYTNSCSCVKGEQNARVLELNF